MFIRTLFIQGNVYMFICWNSEKAGYTKLWNHRQPRTATYNRLQPPRTTHNHLKSPTIIHNHQQLLTKTYNHS